MSSSSSAGRRVESVLGHLQSSQHFTIVPHLRAQPTAVSRTHHTLHLARRPIPRCALAPRQLALRRPHPRLSHVVPRCAPPRLCAGQEEAGGGDCDRCGRQHRVLAAVDDRAGEAAGRRPAHRAAPAGHRPHGEGRAGRHHGAGRLRLPRHYQARGYQRLQDRLHRRGGGPAGGRQAARAWYAAQGPADGQRADLRRPGQGAEPVRPRARSRWWWWATRPTPTPSSPRRTRPTSTRPPSPP